MTDIVLPLLAGFALLYLGGEALVAGSVRLALRAGVSSLAVGLTVVAFGTSSPELVVSLDAAWRGADGIVVGSVVGSNLCNLLLVLGLAAMVRPVEVRRKLLRVDIPVLVVASAALVWALADGWMTRLEGGLFLLALAVYVGVSLWRAKRHESDPDDGVDESPPIPYLDRLPSWLLLLLGLILLTLGAHWFVSGAIELALTLGLSETVIGLTVVAIGTSLPEISAGVLAAWRGQGDLAAGNAVGSCTFNILSILGASAVIRPLDPGDVTSTDLWLMLLAPLALAPFAGTGLRLVRWEGAVLLSAYVAYIVWRVSVG
jgi:cation:H+ antiporter